MRRILLPTTLASALATLPALGGWVAVARAQEAQVVPQRKTGVDVLGSLLTVSVGLQDLFRPAELERLQSGFATRVLVRVYLYRGAERAPIAAGYRRSEIVYDIWEEVFQVRVVDNGGPPIVHRARTQAEAVRLAAALWRFPVAPIAALDPTTSYRVGVRGDLNPLSEELVADVRRWLVSSSGTSFGGDSVFGSFVSIFINPRIDESERNVRFLSQPFVAGQVSIVRPSAQAVKP